MDIDFSVLNGIFSKISDIKDNLTSTDTDKALSAKQGNVLNEKKVSYEDHFEIDTIDATVTYSDDSTETLSLLADITGIDGIIKVAIKWDDNETHDDETVSLILTANPPLPLNSDLTSSSIDITKADNWQKKLVVPIDDGNGNTYTYSWLPNVPSNYVFTTNTNGNLTIITLAPMPSRPSSGEEVPPTP